MFGGLRGSGGIVTVAIAALALALALPGGAAAKKKGKKKPGPVVTVTQTAGNPVGTKVTVPASCPSGTELVGGGYAATPFTTGGSNFVFESRRTGTGTWTVSALNASALAGSLVAEAYCRRGAPTLSEAAASTTLPAAVITFPEGQASASCPSGQNAVAGGFSAAVDTGLGYTGAFVFASTRSAAGTWAVSAMNTDSDDPRAFSSFAYCAIAQSPSVASAIVDVTGAGTPVAATTPACPKVKGKKRKGSKKKPKKKATSALAGGFITPKPDVGLGPGSSHGVFNFESRRSGTTWRASGNSLGTEPGASRLQATAYCG